MTQTAEMPASSLLFPEATPLLGDIRAGLGKAWSAYGARLTMAAASLGLTLFMANGLVLSMTGAGAFG